MYYIIKTLLYVLNLCDMTVIATNYSNYPSHVEKTLNCVNKFKIYSSWITLWIMNYNLFSIKIFNIFNKYEQVNKID